MVQQTHLCLSPVLNNLFYPFQQEFFPCEQYFQNISTSIISGDLNTVIVVKHKFLCPRHAKSWQTEMAAFGAKKGLLQPSKGTVVYIQGPKLPSGVQGSIWKVKFGVWPAGWDAFYSDWGRWWSGRVVFRDFCAQLEVTIPRQSGGLSSYVRPQRYIAVSVPWGGTTTLLYCCTVVSWQLFLFLPLLSLF